MKAVVLKEYGNVSNLQIQERVIPEISENEVLIKVKAAGLNRADIAQREGRYPAPAGTVADILGLEVSGEIVEIGSKVHNFKKGDKVCALLAGGGYAEYVKVDAGSCMKIPKNWTLEEAGSLPEVLCTVWMNIFQIGKLEKNQNVLIYGGSGGIGSFGIQLIKAFGAQAYTLVGSKEKLQFCKNLGAQEVALYKEEDIVKKWGENKMDIILDMVGGDYLNKNIALLKEEGKLVYINASVTNSPLSIFKMMQKRIQITGSTLRNRSLTFKAALIEEISQKAIPLIEEKGVKALVYKSFPYTKVQEAHALMESGNFTGKIILNFEKD